MKKNESHWRRAAREAIRNAIAESAGKSDQEIRKAIRDAYPFGERKYHPYKIWLDEVNIQTGKKKVNPYRQRVKKPVPADPKQERLM